MKVPLTRGKPFERFDVMSPVLSSVQCMADGHYTKRQPGCAFRTVNDG